LAQTRFDAHFAQEGQQDLAPLCLDVGPRHESRG
jgi:hypothetical protein